MSRYFIVPSLAAALLAMPISSAFAEEVKCPGNIINRTVDNVVVNGLCTIRNSTVQGNIVIGTGGDLLVQGSTINGSVQSEGGKRIRLLPNPTTGKDTQVNGDVQVKNTVAGTLVSSITDVAVGGSVQLVSNEVVTNVYGNAVNADVQVFENTKLVRIRDNVIDGNLQCKSNTPPPANGGGNVVQGNAEDQCAGFSQ